MLSLRNWLALLIVAATALFVIGISIERSDSHGEETPAAAQVESGEGEHGEEGEASSEESAGHEEGEEESVLGVNPESTSLIVLAALVSLALALAAWRRPESESLLLLVSAAMLAFAVFDIAEVSHQVEESEAGLAVVAAIVATLHLTASAVAFAMRRRGEPAAT